MYRKPRFLKVLHAIRERMSREVDYYVDLFVERIRAGEQPIEGTAHNLSVYDNGKTLAEPAPATIGEATGQIKRRKRAAR
jgi:hypothetical protein